MIEIFLLAVVQGITEFLPISSSAHLILISKYFNFENNNLTIDMSLHVGSLLAVLFFFKNDFFSVVKNKNLFFKIVISSIPVLCVGYLLVKFEIIDYLRSYEIIGWMTIIFGVVLYFADKSVVKNNINKF
jgi:undecaprenyl-diphosphatase